MWRYIVSQKVQMVSDKAQNRLTLSVFIHYHTFFFSNSKHLPARYCSCWGRCSLSASLPSQKSSLISSPLFWNYSTYALTSTVYYTALRVHTTVTECTSSLFLSFGSWTQSKQSCNHDGPQGETECVSDSRKLFRLQTRPSIHGTVAHPQEQDGRWASSRLS